MSDASNSTDLVKLDAQERDQPHALALRFEVRDALGRTAWERQRPQLIAGALTGALVLIPLVAFAAWWMQKHSGSGSYHLNLAIPATFLYVPLYRFFSKLRIGTIDENEIVACTAAGHRRAIPFGEIVTIEAVAPREHFGVMLLLQSGERVFLDCGWLAYPSSVESTENREKIEKEAAELYARAAILHRHVVEGHRAWLANNGRYRISAAALPGPLLMRSA